MKKYMTYEAKKQLAAITPELKHLSAKTNRELEDWCDRAHKAIVQLHKASEELERVADKYPNELAGQNLNAFMQRVIKRLGELSSDSYFNLNDHDTIEGLQEAATDAMYEAEEREEAAQTEKAGSNG